MKSLNCWFKSMDDKSMFQERMPVREKETETQVRSEGLDFREHFQAHRRGKEREGIRMVVMISLTNVFKKGGQSYV